MIKKICISAIVIIAVLAVAFCGIKIIKGNRLIETPYCNIELPEELRGKVKWSVYSESPYILKFTAKKDNTDLFALLFGKKTEDVLGTLHLEDEEITIYAKFNNLNRDSQKYEEYVGYQMKLGLIIDQLSQNYNFIPGEEIDNVKEEVFEIPTNLVTLKYPSKWKGVVNIEASASGVVFAYKGAKIFELRFVECDGVLIGKYRGTPVYILSYEVEEEYFTEDELNTINGISRDVNVIIEYLEQNEEFKIAQ